MPRIEYRRYRPREAARAVIETANTILAEYIRQDFRLTLRQLYYQFIGRDLFPESWIDPKYNKRHGLSLDTKNTEKNYKKLVDIVVDARVGGLMDWDHIVDREREVESESHWENAPDFLNSVAPQFNIDVWADQPNRVEVWVEKKALVEIVGRACEPLDVPYLACKGYLSASAAWDAGHNRCKRWHDEHGQNTVVIHLSDHDPSGLDMGRDNEERLRLFRTPYKEGETPAHITFQRIALTMEQVEQYEPPSNPAKETDPRAAAYIEEHGDTSWELDALEPPVLVELIMEAILEHLDRDLYDGRRAEETEQRDLLVRMSRHFDTLVNALDDMEEDED